MTHELSLEGWFPVELGQVFQTERDAHAGPHGRKGQRDRKGQWAWRRATWGSRHGFNEQSPDLLVILLSAPAGLLQSA